MKNFEVFVQLDKSKTRFKLGEFEGKNLYIIGHSDVSRDIWEKITETRAYSEGVSIVFKDVDGEYNTLITIHPIDIVVKYNSMFSEVRAFFIFVAVGTLCRHTLERIDGLHLSNRNAVETLATSLNGKCIEASRFSDMLNDEESAMLIDSSYCVVVYAK